MTINKNIRNIAIVLVLAVIVDFVRGGQAAANTVMQAISLAFLALLAWIASRLYREHRTDIDSLGTRNRATLYIALGVAAVTLTASPRLDATPGGTVALIVLLAGSVFALFQVARAYRQY
jgi:hypothetical protein